MVRESPTSDTAISTQSARSVSTAVLFFFVEKYFFYERKFFLRKKRKDRNLFCSLFLFGNHAPSTFRNKNKKTKGRDFFFVYLFPTASSQLISASLPGASRSSPTGVKAESGSTLFFFVFFVSLWKKNKALRKRKSKKKTQKKRLCQTEFGWKNELAATRPTSLNPWRWRWAPPLPSP